MQENINKICLLCHTDTFSNHIYINSDIGTQLNIKHILNQHFGIEATVDDNSEIYICEDCWSITNAFHKLYEKVLQNKNSLLFVVVKKEENQYLHDGISVRNVTTDDPPDENDDIKNEPELNDATDENCDNSDILENNLDDTLNLKEERPKRYEKKHSKSISNSPQYSENESYFDDVAADIDYEDSICKTKTKLRNRPSKNKKKPSKLKKSTNPTQQNNKTSEEILKENQQIKDFFPMTCDLCDYGFLNYLDIRTHYTKIHKQVGYLKCCKKKFYRRSRILDHMNRHLNPDAYKCPQCQKFYVNKQALKNHMDHHAPIDQRPFKCDICTSSFTKLYKLSQHIRLSHCSKSDKKFQCAECGKSFLTKSILTTHIRGVHEFAYAHICHICAKTFKSKQVYESHQREHLNIEIPRVKCNLCSSWLKNEHSLRSHMARHNAEHFTCNLCNKVAPNKNALGSHMRDVHSERTHQCTLCEKAFTKARSLKEHMATHTGEDIYTCTYCPMTFKSGANMHSHRKKMHLEEWLLEKVKRQKP